MIEIPRVRDEDGVSAITAHLQSHGCVIIERLVPEDLLEHIEADLSRVLEKVGTNNTAFAGQNTKRLNGVLSLVPATQKLAMHPTIIAMVERMLLPYCVRYQLNYDSIMHLMPGETSQDLHRDGFIYPFRHPAPAYTVACMWAQSEFTLENGATCLVPGSHLWEHERKPRAEEVIQAVMPAGSVVLYTGGTYHGAGANRSNAPRTGISLQYSYAWLRQELNMYLTYPPKVAKTFPGELQRLIGYDFAAPYLGFVDGGSPQTLLKDGPPETRERSRPEIDEAFEKLEPIALGDGVSRINFD